MKETKKNLILDIFKYFLEPLHIHVHLKMHLIYLNK